MTGARSRSFQFCAPGRTMFFWTEQDLARGREGHQKEDDEGRHHVERDQVEARVQRFLCRALMRLRASSSETS